MQKVNNGTTEEIKPRLLFDYLLMQFFVFGCSETDIISHLDQFGEYGFGRFRLSIRLSVQPKLVQPAS